MSDPKDDGAEGRFEFRVSATLSASEADRLYALYVNAFATSPERTWSCDAFLSTLRANQSRVGILHRGEDFISFALLSLIDTEAEILTVCTDRRFLGQGYAQRLLLQIRHVLQKFACSRLLLDVRQSNLSAIMLYKKIGFEAFGERADYYRLADGTRIGALLMQYSFV